MNEERDSLLTRFNRKLAGQPESDPPLPPTEDEPEEEDDDVLEGEVLSRGRAVQDDTRMLINFLKEKAVGSVIYKSELTTFIGADVTKLSKDGGALSNLTGAVRQLDKEGIVWRPLERAEMLRRGRGPALVRLDDVGKQKWAKTRGKTASNIARRAQGVLGTISDMSYRSMSDEERSALDVTRATLKVIHHVGLKKAQDKLKIGLADKNAEQSINQTLQTLLLPSSEHEKRAEERRARREARRS